MDKAGKQNIVSSLNEAFLNAKTVVVTHFTGLTVDEITKLRTPKKTTNNPHNMINAIHT